MSDRQERKQPHNEEIRKREQIRKDHGESHKLPPMERKPPMPTVKPPKKEN